MSSNASEIPQQLFRSMQPPPRPASAAPVDPTTPRYPPKFITSPANMEGMNGSDLIIAKAYLGRDLIHLDDTMKILVNKVKLFREIITNIGLRHISLTEANKIYRAHTTDMLAAFSFLAVTICKVELQFRNLTHGGGIDVNQVIAVEDLKAWNLREVSFEEWRTVMGNVGFMPLVGNRVDWLEKWTRLVRYAWVMTHQYVEGSKVEWVDWGFSKEGQLRMWKAVKVFVEWGEEALIENKIPGESF